MGNPQPSTCNGEGSETVRVGTVIKLQPNIQSSPRETGALRKKAGRKCSAGESQRKFIFFQKKVGL